MKAITKSFSQDRDTMDILASIQKGEYPLAVAGCSPGQDAHLISLLGQDFRCRLIVTSQESRAKQLYEDLSFFDENTVWYPSRDLLFYSADVHGNQIAATRIGILSKILKKEEITVVVCADALMEKMVPADDFQKQSLRITAESVIEMAAFRRKLVEMGYEVVSKAENPGQFAIRGGIIDIYPLTEELPVRIELWGDEVDSMRTFHPENQRSIENVSEVTIDPASEVFLSSDRIPGVLSKMREEYHSRINQLNKKKKRAQKSRLRQNMERMENELSSFGKSRARESLIEYFFQDTVSLLSYFPEDTICFLDEEQEIIRQTETFGELFLRSMENREEEGYILPGQKGLIFDADTIVDQLKEMHLICLSQIGGSSGRFTPAKTYMAQARSIPSFSNRFEDLIGELKRWIRQDYRILLLTPSATRGKRLAEDIMEYDIISYYRKNSEAELVSGQVAVAQGVLSAGFEYPGQKLAVLTEKDIFKKRKKRIYRSRWKDLPQEKIVSIQDISVGDYVVHERYGLGIYRGMEKIEKEGITRDYISIEYQDASSLLIGASQLSQIQKYSNLSGKPPKLNKLGTQDWEKTKARAREKIAIAARELIELYAARQNRKGYACGPDTVWQTEFEERFPFEETEDQLTAIEETKQDMESNKIMDRLLCGDVGYGKTEVAIRAAFKEVQESRQVIYLVPTTILAQQHYHTFCDRMEGYPVEIAMLSRFCSAKEVRGIQEGLKKGSIDIVIGTHKVLSKKISFAKLGLLIIDEEQRFGVRQKEKIKQIKKDVDVLSLSATPIPRTLHMSLSGIRDMSVLGAPPIDRQSIQTYVMEYNEVLVKEAIQRELSRGGQVYYVYNRVSTIPDVAARIRELVPDAVVEYAHGRMGERQLEEIMKDFISGEIQVLVSTTIIETGLDIPNVNTMIVQDANRFGLSQLYQLRGRVGRSSRKAYAFLMYQRDALLNKDARKRLAAIRDFTDLGSGFKIAMRDLEIRGAGNLLGAEQSGHMEEIGYELYCKMLKDTINNLQGEEQEEEFTTSIELPIDAYIPSDYIENEADKLSWYKKIALIRTREDMDDLTDEMTDRYGDIPKPVFRLLEVALLKEEAHKAWIVSVTQKNDRISFEMDQAAPVKVEMIDDFLKSFAGAMFIRTQREPAFVYDPGKIRKKDLLSKVAEIIARIAELIDR